jgi:hypothetical protein
LPKIRLEPKAKVEYKKPSRINAVSIALLLVLGLLVYVAMTLWPVFAVRSAVKAAMLDQLPLLWRANLRPPSVANPELVRLKKVLTAQIRQAGVKDDKLEIKFERDKKRVAIEARFALSARFRYPDKLVWFHCAPRVETDAAHIEW